MFIETAQDIAALTVVILLVCGGSVIVSEVVIFILDKIAKARISKKMKLSEGNVNYEE